MAFINRGVARARRCPPYRGGAVLGTLVDHGDQAGELSLTYVRLMTSSANLRNAGRLRYPSSVKSMNSTAARNTGSQNLKSAFSTASANDEVARGVSILPTARIT